MKKLISVLLVVLMLLSLAAPTVSAVGTVSQHPVVYVAGYGGALYKTDGVASDETEIYPTGVDVGQVISDALKPCLQELAGGLITGNYDRYCDELYNAFAPIYDDLRLDKNGEASDGSGDAHNMQTAYVVNKSSDYTLDDYDFYYDWRLSPMDIADDLKMYIDRVKAATGKKVALVGRCLGGNIVSAYLAKYEEHAIANVESIVMYIPSTMGIDSIGALFSGEIKLNADILARFANHLLTTKDFIEDPVIKSLVTATIDLFNYVTVLGLGTDALQFIVDQVKENLVPRVCRASYGSFPSFWAMMPPEYIEKAIAFVYKGVEDEYEGMIAKIKDYYENVQLTAYDVMTRLKAAGVGISIVAKYNIPVLPLYEGADSQGDLLAETSDISFGATCSQIHKTLDSSYIDSLEDKKYVSPDLKIDASTCLFPDNTWFIKNISHSDFPDSLDMLIYAAINSSGELTVFDNEKYPQYIDYNAETEEIFPVAGVDPEEPEKGSKEERFSVLIRFITAILNFFTKLFSGELSLGGLFGGETA